MPIKGRIIGDLNGVEEAQRKLYIPLKDRDGKEVLSDGKPVFTLDVEDMEHKDDIRGLKSALEKEQA